jgi:hypothetical protein
MHWHEFVVDIFGESVRRPLLFAIPFCENEIADQMTVISGLVLLNDRVMPVNSHAVVVMRDRESEDFSMQFSLALQGSI